MLPSRPITYITREIERALGMDAVDNYRIISGKTSYGDRIATKFPGNVQLIQGETALGTRELIEHASKSGLLTAGSDIIVFKNTARVEEASIKAGFKLLNPKAVLSETVENKMSQVEWLGEIGKKYLPAHAVLPTRNLVWTGEPFIVQWAHGHTGGGTLLIESEEHLKSIQEKFPFRIARRSTYISGPSYTVNAVVATDRILTGNISYQITGITPFTDGTFSTIGNDWSVVRAMLNEDDLEYMQSMVYDIGKKLNVSGWRGLYGVDVIQDNKSGAIHLIEINARQPASTSFESFLQTQNREHGAQGLTTFEAHIKALLGEKIDGQLIPVNDGAQIIQRVTKTTKTIPETSITALESSGYATVPYPNTEYNTDMLRIQSPRGIMEKHNTFNQHGQEIVKLISPQ